MNILIPLLLLAIANGEKSGYDCLRLGTRIPTRYGNSPAHGTPSCSIKNWKKPEKRPRKDT